MGRPIQPSLGFALWRSCSKMAHLCKIGGEFFIRQLEGAGYIKQEFLLFFGQGRSPKNGRAGAQIKRALQQCRRFLRTWSRRESCLRCRVRIGAERSQLSGLTQFSQAQFAYGQQIGVDARLYAYTALGVALASGNQHFQNEFGSANSAYPNSTAGDAKFVTDAYVNVSGHAGSAAQVQHFVDQLNYYEGIYTAAGVFGDASNIDLLARGAVYGQMLGVEYEMTPVGGQPVSLVGVTSSVMHSVLE